MAIKQVVLVAPMMSQGAAVCCPAGPLVSAYACSLAYALRDWHDWAGHQLNLCGHAKRLCYGSRCNVTVYDRAVIGGASFSAMTTEGKKLSRNSVVLMKDISENEHVNILIF